MNGWRRDDGTLDVLVTYRRAAALARQAILIAITLSSAALPAQEFTLGNVTIAGPWSREMPPGAPNGAAYFRVENRGGEPDRIVSAHTGIAEAVELHTHDMEDGMMKMRQVESVDVPAGGAVLFKPHGMHLMLFGLKQPLVNGERFDLTVVFEKAGVLDLSVDIKRTK